ncbi:MAG TPA: hypothetical protein PK668_26520 [Myxococcota bacterium]|nr:hypothetical protein [Myxococcota bacterium]HRY97083.1 hypothetical protein [Myxococcota bacterium]HSA21122.1 hypothetical protein [Myxococcota bacterium]
MRASFALLVGLTSWSLGGCGGDGDAFAACKSAMTALCDKACECTGGGACNMGNDIGGSFPFESRQECLDWYVVAGCRDSDGDFPPDSFFEGCEAAVATAQCRTDPDPAVIVPAACVYQGD